MSLYHTIFIKRAFDTPEKLGVLNKYVYKLTKYVPVPALVPVVLVPVAQALAPANAFQNMFKIDQVPVKKPEPEPEPELVVKIPTKSDPKSSYFTDKTDSLFWCLYIAAHGHPAYESIGRGYSNVEIAEKQKIIEFVRKNQGIAKTKVMAQEIMSDLMTNKRASLMVLPALAAFYKKQIVITKQNRFYIDIPGTEDSDTLYLIKNERGNYGIDYSNPSPNLNKLIRLNNYDKPLAAISTYKIGDLTELAIQVGIDTTVKRNKADLYQAVTIKCLW
jgi:hypothetical protein